MNQFYPRIALFCKLGYPFAVAMDEAEVHQQLGNGGDGRRGKDALHQRIPIADLLLRRAIVALLGPAFGLVKMAQPDHRHLGQSEHRGR